MPSQCNFSLTSGHEVYYSGEDTVDGIAFLTTSSSKKIKGIKIRFKGKAKCALEQKSANPENECGIEMSGGFNTSKQSLTKFELTVLGAGILPAGSYRFPFCFPVPSSCPTSMESPKGHIRYQLSLKIYNEQKYKNTFVKPVTVIKPEEFIEREEMFELLKTSAGKIYCCGIIRSGPLLTLSTDYHCYVPGQTMFNHFAIKNKNLKKQYKYLFEFIKRETYTTVKPEKCVTRKELVLLKYERAGNHEAKEDFSFEFEVPPTPPKTKTKYISIDYLLKLTVSRVCCPKILIAVLKTPIGTVPYRPSLSSAERLVFTGTRGGSIRPLVYNKPVSIDQLPITFIDRSKEEINRDDKFVPVYPLFKMP